MRRRTRRTDGIYQRGGQQTKPNKPMLLIPKSPYSKDRLLLGQRLQIKMICLLPWLFLRHNLSNTIHLLPGTVLETIRLEFQIKEEVVAVEGIVVIEGIAVK
jgi:hypothetical protein